MARSDITTLTPTAQAVLSGEEDLSQWTDAELLRGRRGKKGRPPKVVPHAILRELTRRRMDKANEVLRESVVDAVKLWAEVVRDPLAPMGYRIEASKLIADRVLGKATEKIAIAARVSHSFEDLPIFKAMATIPGLVLEEDGTPVPIPPHLSLSQPEPDVIDAEVIEEDDDPILEPDDGLDPDDEWDG